jgi:ABC-type glutathione transport system ATPase component
MKYALNIEQLWVHAQHNTSDNAIVRGVNLQLAAGSCLTLLGESGSGKSILAQAIMGTLPAGLVSQGRIVIAEKAVSSPTALWGHQMAMLAQEPWLSLNPTMPLLAQVAEVLHFVRRMPWKQAQQHALQILERLSLQGASQQFVHQISGGMAQRIAFAATTATGASLLIADEPTKGLDVTLRDRVSALLTQHVQNHADNALLTITHDVELAARLGGHLAVMLQGEIIEQGPAQDVLQNPKHAYTQALIAATPRHWPTLFTSLPADAPTLLDGMHLSKRFGQKTLFNDVSFGLKTGEVLAITGPSGCGKTTLGHMVMGIEPVSHGKVQWHKAHKAYHCQKLYQDPPAAFAPYRLLRLALQDLIDRHRLDWARVYPWMHQLQLGEELLDRLPSEVSGGELQRFALIRVLLMQPALVFADEPTSRLDPILQQHTMRMIVEHAQHHGFGVLLVTHDPDLAHRSAHRTISHLFDRRPHC